MRPDEFGYLIHIAVILFRGREFITIETRRRTQRNREMERKKTVAEIIFRFKKFAPAMRGSDLDDKDCNKDFLLSPADNT